MKGLSFKTVIVRNFETSVKFNVSRPSLPLAVERVPSDSDGGGGPAVGNLSCFEH